MGTFQERQVPLQLLTQTHGMRYIRSPAVYLFIRTILSDNLKYSLIASSGGSGILWSLGEKVLEKSSFDHFSMFFLHSVLSSFPTLFSAYILTRALLLNRSLCCCIPEPRRQPLQKKRLKWCCIVSIYLSKSLIASSISSLP